MSKDSALTPSPRAGRSRNPTRWLVGIEDFDAPDYREVEAVGAKAAADAYVSRFDPGMEGDVVVWPLRPGKGPMKFSVKSETVTQTTITEAT